MGNISTVQNPQQEIQHIYYTPQSCLLNSACVRFSTNMLRWSAGGWIIFTGLFEVPLFGGCMARSEGNGRSACDDGNDDCR